VRLQLTDEKRVAIFKESATSAAGFTNRPGRGDGGVGLAINLEDSLFDSHSLIIRTRRVISSGGINSPWPAPGQVFCVRFQSAAVAVLLSQKGQVRHWAGRTG